MSWPIPSDWPHETVWLPQTIYETARASIDAMAPDAEIQAYNSDDDVDNVPHDPAVPGCGIEIRWPISENKPSIKIGILCDPPKVALGPLEATFDASHGWYWERSFGADEDNRIVTDFKNELERWLAGRIAVFYVFKGSKMVGCQINDRDTVLWSSWRKRLWSTRDVYIVCNDPRRVDGFVKDQE